MKSIMGPISGIARRGLMEDTILLLVVLVLPDRKRIDPPRLESSWSTEVCCVDEAPLGRPASCEALTLAMSV